MWFKKSQPTNQTILPESPVVYPAGICVHTVKGYYLINEDGKRYRLATDAMFKSWNFPVVVITTEAALANHPVAFTKLHFRDGTLLNNIADGKLYLVSGRKLRHVTSPAVLDRLGITKKDAVLASDAEIKMMKLGEDIY